MFKQAGEPEAKPVEEPVDGCGDGCGCGHGVGPMPPVEEEPLAEMPEVAAADPVYAEPEAPVELLAAVAE